MRLAVLLAVLLVGGLLSGLDPAGALLHTQRPALDGRASTSGLVVKVAFKCRRVDGKLVCGKAKTDSTGDSSKESPKPVEQPCPAGMVGKQPNCECPDGTYLAAFVGCVPVIPTAPAPSAPAPSGRRSITALPAADLDACKRLLHARREA
jgi:hypothetical protein